MKCQLLVLAILVLIEGQAPLLDANIFWDEHHSDGGEIVPRRSYGKVEAEPFIAGRFRRYSPTTRGGRFEWRVGNVAVGQGAAMTEAIRLGGDSIGTCHMPLCVLEVEVDEFEGLEVVLLDSNGGKTEYRARIAIPPSLKGSGPEVMRTERCLPTPRRSESQELYVTDVLYSMARKQIVLFGPTRHPLGGLYCTWEQNPETCRGDCPNKKHCHSDRIPEEIRRSLYWHDLVESSQFILQCVFRGEGGHDLVVEAEVWPDPARSLNVAVCTPPDDVQAWLVEGVPDLQGHVTPSEPDSLLDGSVVEGVLSLRLHSNDTGGSGEGRTTAQRLPLPMCRHCVGRQDTHKHKISVCAIFRDQAMYLAEWVQFHLMLGIEHFYLYDHKSVDSPLDELWPFIREGVVDVHSWNLPGYPQKEAQLHCMHKYGHETDWLIMMDVDEFLLLGHGVSDLMEVIEELQGTKKGVFDILQEFYGHQNFTIAPQGLVIENYLYHSDDMSQFEYRRKYMFRPHEVHTRIPCVHSVSCDEDSFSAKIDPSVLRMNHYTIKSVTHWKSDHIKRFQPVPEKWNEVLDTQIIDRYLEGLKNAMCRSFRRIYDGPKVSQLPEGASCEDHFVPTTTIQDRQTSPVNARGSGAQATHDHTRAVALRIIDPKEGTTALRAKLVFEVLGVKDWEDFCFVEVLFDGSDPGSLELVSVIASSKDLPLELDRDRDKNPRGPTWHNLLLRLKCVDDDAETYLAEKHIRFRLTGSKHIVGGEQARSNLPSHPENLALQRKGFPVAYPQVCAAFMSCKRLHLLRLGLRALIEHMEHNEPDIPYEIAWVDNNSGQDAVTLYLEFEIERTALFRANYGATHGINTLLFDLCRRSRYVITLEEDWEWDPEMAHVPVVEMAIQVILHDPKVIGVTLRSDNDEKMELSGWEMTAGSPAVEYRRQCVREGTFGWGAWTNGAAVWDRDLLEKEIGPQDEEWGDGAELEYSQRVGARFCAAQMRIRPGCEESSCNAVVKHIGEDNKGNLIRSPGWEQHVGGFEQTFDLLRTIHSV